MKVKQLITWILISVTIGATCQESQLLTKPGLEPSVHGVLVKPENPGTHSAVIILYGSSGWRPEYVTMANTLADAGFIALVLDYYAAAEAAADMSNNQAMWPRWQASLKSAVAYLMDDPATEISAIGLLGFSLGGFLAVSTANAIPEVKAVVEFFGGALDELDLESQVRDFPPLLILHGEKDEAVPVSKAYELSEAVLAHGGEVEIKIYPDAPHGFNAPWIPYYNDSLATDSFERTVDFFQRKLQNQ